MPSFQVVGALFSRRIFYLADSTRFAFIGNYSCSQPLGKIALRDNFSQFDQTLNKTLKYGLLIFGIAIIAVIGFVSYGLYLMEIEDHYGDIQNFHFKSKNGDLIINKSTSEFGIVEKTWKRLNIRTNEKDSTDLYFWVYKNGVQTKAEVYRPKDGGIELNGITYSELMKKIDNSELKLITRN
ncbi:hypothetical protein [Flavobacterium macacae]|uniref:Uncharacterized protein n=1 Tax=Flavobacterium macacae TaxID=2488993 RepID=A0A3P3W512_9FLAO|nr:hypothetical protein [Flavobacterium macacae]RRJ90152.1 hypothetical protein EG849_10860 [Flavobacterium macacae]